METTFIDSIYAQIVQYVNVPYLITFMLIAYGFKKGFQEILQEIISKKYPTVKLNLTMIVFMMATILGVVFIIAGTEWQKILFSYAIGTSLHELIFTHIENKFKK